MAVLEQWRGRGIGALILHALVQEARERGHAKVALSAQVHALDFYRAQGFEPIGDVYEEAGIAHQAMVRSLA
jgi:predicted GNAT family N-acyltransferase